jgi:hypothetical protein
MAVKVAKHKNGPLKIHLRIHYFILNNLLNGPLILIQIVRRYRPFQAQDPGTIIGRSETSVAINIKAERLPRSKLFKMPYKSSLIAHLLLGPVPGTMAANLQ